MNKLIGAADKLTIPATTVSGNEKALSYQEVNLQSPGNHGFHRYRIILVNRDGKLAEFRQDMGESKLYGGVWHPITIPSLWEHTVDELMDIADYLRGEWKVNIKELMEVDKVKVA